MWILATLIVASLCGVRLQITTSMRWVDHIDEDDMNIFFDRAVIITIADPDEKSYLKTDKGLALGVFLTGQLILTSFNPFRQYIKKREMKSKVTISVLLEREITDWQNISYTLGNYTVDCARQVIPLPPKLNIWHDDKQEQSPLHDLMVIRLNSRVTFITRTPSLYSFDQYEREGAAKRTTGPMRTPLARPGLELGRDLEFASLGFLNNRHIFRSCQMRSHKFDPEDNVVTNCDQWIPRQWGRFICIRNIMKFKGVGAGLLIQNHQLFGIGSFMLKKGNSSILVFTDTREYYHLVRRTCTADDQKLIAVANTTAYNSKEDYATTTSPDY